MARSGRSPSTPDGDSVSQLELRDDAVDALLLIAELQRDAWKGAFTATRSYYRNNTGPNAKRYREAIERLKELKLLK